MKYLAILTLIGITVAVLFNCPATLRSENLTPEQKQRLAYFRARLDSLGSAFLEMRFEEALKLAEAIQPQVSAYPELEDYAQLVNSYLYPLHNFSDYNREPLKLLIKARVLRLGQEQYKGVARDSVIHEIENLYETILDSFPNCNLAGYTQYMLGKHYILNDEYYGTWEQIWERARSTHEKMLNGYPEAEIPWGWEFWLQGKPGGKVAPWVLMEIADGYVWSRASDFQPDVAKAFAYYQKVIDEYPGAIDQCDRRIDLYAYYRMLQICLGKQDRVSYEDTSQAREICYAWLMDYENAGFGMGMGFFGQIHPEAYMILAEIEKDTAQSIRYYEKVMEQYPTSLTGYFGSGDIWYYGPKAVRKYAELYKKPKERIGNLRKIEASDYHEVVQGTAQSLIASTYYHQLKDYAQALKEYEKLRDQYGHISGPGEGMTLQESAGFYIKSIKEKLEQENQKQIIDINKSGENQ